MKPGRALVFTCLTFCLHFNLYAQDSVRSALLSVDSLYSSGAYLRAEVEARRLLEHPSLGDSAVITLHKYIAFSLIAQGKTDIAREHFKSVLTIDPDYSLDPVLTSPKILLVFNETKRSFLSSRKLLRDTLATPVKRGQSSITYRTVVFPGWEQLHEGRTTMGSLFLGAGVATLGSGLVFEILRSSAHQEYLAGTVPSDISSKYDLYNRYYKSEIASFIAFAVVYISSEINVFASDRSPSVSIQSAVTPSRGTVLTFAVRF